MPGRHKAPLLGWHPPPELAVWAREEAERRGGRGALSDLLTEALAEYRQRTMDPPGRRHEELLEAVEDLRDRLSVHEREGLTIGLDKLKAELGLVPELDPVKETRS